jgi:hypothetical protein
MPIQKYRYAIELYRGDGTCLGQTSSTVDWVPALEAAWLQGLRRGQLHLSDGTDASLIRPSWHPEAGQPYVEGFRVTMLSEHADGVSLDFSTDFFRSAAGAATARLIEEGRLNKQDPVRYLSLAFFNEGHAGNPAQAGPNRPGPNRPLTTREMPPDITLVESRLSDFVSASTPVHPSAGETDAGDIPIVIPRRILDETRELAARAGNNETGGVLIGHLRRDAGHPELFVEITAQIPAKHAPAEVNRLTFTPETWQAAQAAIELRRNQEVLLGWWHDHKMKEICRDCPEEKRVACPLAHGFLSADDRLLHRTVFSKAFTCALVVSDIGDGHDVVNSLFGWRRGLLEPRGFHVAGDTEGACSGATGNTATRQSDEP